MPSTCGEVKLRLVLDGATATLACPGDCRDGPETEPECVVFVRLSTALSNEVIMGILGLPLPSERVSSERGVGGRRSPVPRLRSASAACFSDLSSTSVSISASSRATRSLRFFLWSTMTSDSADSWSTHLEPLAKHSVHTPGLSGAKIHLILRRRPMRSQ